MIEIKNLSVKLGKKEILKDVSLLAPNGEITVILGANGSGKTTLFRSIFSTRGVGNDGEIYVNSVCTSDMSQRDIAKKVALMPQNMPLPTISTLELVSYGRAPYTGAFGNLSESDRAKVETAIRRVELWHLKDSLVSLMSGGERQRAFFAMILAREAENVLLDEPASSLDAPSKSRLISFVKALKAQGKCVVMIMHDLTDALAVADAVYLLDEGVMSPRMTPSEFASSDAVREIFHSAPYELKTENGEVTVFRPLD